MHLRDNTKVFSIRCANRMDRTEACLAAFDVSVQRNRFCTMGAFSWQKSPVKILFARKVQDGRAKRPHSGTLRREQAPALPCKMHFVRSNWFRVVETPTPTHKIECVCPANPDLSSWAKRRISDSTKQTCAKRDSSPDGSEWQWGGFFVERRRMPIRRANTVRPYE